MTLEQFRAFALDVKAVASGPQTLAAQHVDECFGEAAKHQGGGKGAGAKKASDSSIQLDAFLVAVLRVAARKYDIATAKQQGFAELSARLERFVDAHVSELRAPVGDHPRRARRRRDGRLDASHEKGAAADDADAHELPPQTPGDEGGDASSTPSLATHAKKWGLSPPPPRRNPTPAERPSRAPRTRA